MPSPVETDQEVLAVEGNLVCPRALTAATWCRPPWGSTRWSPRPRRRAVSDRRGGHGRDDNDVVTTVEGTGLAHGHQGEVGEDPADRVVTTAATTRYDFRFLTVEGTHGRDDVVGQAAIEAAGQAHDLEGEHGGDPANRVVTSTSTWWGWPPGEPGRWPAGEYKDGVLLGLLHVVRVQAAKEKLSVLAIYARPVRSVAI